MFKLISLSLLLLLFGCGKAEVKVQPHKQNQMVDGCVYQESQGKVIKTCG
jgi:hypothetical protein